MVRSALGARCCAQALPAIEPSAATATIMIVRRAIVSSVMYLLGQVASTTQTLVLLRRGTQSIMRRRSLLLTNGVGFDSRRRNIVMVCILRFDLSVIV